MSKTFPIELDEDLHKRLKIAAIEEGLTLHDLVVRTLEEKVGGRGGGGASAKRKGNNERNRNR